MWLAALRDVAIILLAIESIVIGVLLALLLLQVRKLVMLLRDEIAPLLNSANSTMNKVETTTHFVSDTVVNPLVQVISYAKGSAETIRVLLQLRKRMRGPSKPKRIYPITPHDVELRSTTAGTPIITQDRPDDL
jgi:hypothetical protein